MYALDALAETGVWRTLKRALNHAKLELQPLEMFFPFGTSALKPEPVDLNVKIVLIGDPELYELLYEHEEEFKKIFKVRVEFDEEMAMSDDAIQQYSGLLRKLCEDEGLCPFDRTAVAAMIEYGVRLAGRRNKITSRFADLADLMREACYVARQRGETPVTSSHLRAAREAKVERHNPRTGQVNGLSVFEIGGYAFGKPVRITASVAMGKSGIINIERESNLSGRLHDKGMQIIAGYLRSLFAQDKPLSLAASICFEQSYTGIEGDSASSTEVYALLSALADLPLRQDIAVTGSVNQRGIIQPIGGVNQKVEGFYDVCRIKGLNGTQGVLIPIENVEDLMLRADLIEAVAAGKFHIYPIAHIEEGIEILTGVPAGARDGAGHFESDTVFGRVDDRLRQMAHTLKQFE
jgi:predicted ATP-dependent protease